MTIASADPRCSLTAAFARVLAIDAEPDMRPMLENGLGNLGFDVKVVTDAHAAVKTVHEWMPEAVLLEGRLQGMDAASLLVSLRRITDVPILMIGGEDEIQDKLLALSLGADDHIAKPFDLDEVAAYIRARLRRPRMETRDIVTYSDMTIDVTQRKVVRAGKPVDLSTREFDLLLALSRHPEQVFTRSQLLDLVWGIDREVTQATVETYISYLRSKINENSAKSLIHTIRGVGYTLRARR